MTTLVCIPPDRIEQVWPLVSGMIERAYAVMDLPMPDVLPWLLDNKGLLWVAFDGHRIVAAMTSSLVPRPSGLGCRLVAAGGNGGLAVWKDHIAEIESYAKSEGCVKVYFDGRPGWGGVLAGYTPKAVSFERGL